jgi:L-lactate dehydrogenase complex protein LldG
MSNKQEILNALRRTRLPNVELPSLSGDYVTFDDPAAQFRTVLEAVGGRAVTVRDSSDLEASLRQIDAYRSATNVWSLVPGIASKGHAWASIDDPHGLAALEFLVVPGAFAVAENAAVWLSDNVITHRAALFVTQHLALIVPAAEIVHNMHEAYERISFDNARFGAFISGPSKTADIEQSLVIGAHGARSTTVLLVP